MIQSRTQRTQAACGRMSVQESFFNSLRVKHKNDLNAFKDLVISVTFISNLESLYLEGIKYAFRSDMC